MKVLGFADYRPQAQRLAACLELPYCEINVHRFPDGESKVTVPTELSEHIVICRSMDQPNDKLIELLLAASVIRQHNVRRLTLVAPYLCYMRQDKAFHPGEAVSQAVFGRCLAEVCDDLLTVDPHLHRTRSIEQAIPKTNALALTATVALGDYLHRRWQRPLLVGPDSESEQWVKAIAVHHGLDYAIASKQRLGDSDVRITLPDLTVENRDVVLVDDIASTARTLIATAVAFRGRGMRSISALVTHALFSEEIRAQMRDSGITFVGSSDSVAHSSNVIQLAPVLADALRSLTDA